MKAYLDQMERLGYPMPLVLGFNMILTSLSKDYDQFVQNYNMHGMGKTILQLHAMLKLAEKAQGKGKQRGNGKSKLAYGPKHKIPPPAKKDIPAKDIECHHYHKTGHWKRNCPLYLAELKKNKASASSTSGIFTIEMFSFPKSNTWIYDTGCGTHICNTIQGLKGYRKLNKGALDLYVGNGNTAAVEAIGSFDLILPSGMILVLDNWYEVLEMCAARVGMQLRSSPKVSTSSPLVSSSTIINVSRELYSIDVAATFGVSIKYCGFGLNKSTSYAGVAGGSAKDQPNVNSNFRTLVADPVFDGVNISIPRKVVEKVSTRFEHTLYGYFIGKRMAFPVVEYYARNNWAKHGLKRIMMNSKGFFFFKFDSRAGLEAVLEGGPWLIRKSPIILKKWSMDTRLLKEELTRIPIWVKLHDVPIQVFEEDGISLIATFIGKPVMLDSYTSSMCNDSWGRSSFARCLIEVNSEADLVDVVTIGIPSLSEDDFTKETIRVEYEWRPPRCDTCKIFGHVHDYCPKKVVSPPIVATSNVVTPNAEKTNDGFQTVGKKKKRKGKSKSTNGGQFTGPSVKHNVRYEPKATTSAPKKGTTYVGYTSQSTPMLKTTGNSSKKDNLSMSNSFSALNEEEDDDEEDVENVYDESANLIQNTKAGGSSSFTAAAATFYLFLTFSVLIYFTGVTLYPKNKKRIEKLQHDGLLESIDDESFDVYVSCISGKMARKPFTHASKRADDLLGIIQSDVFGPFRTTSREDFLKRSRKSTRKDNKSTSIESRRRVFKQEFLDHLRSRGIISQLTPPYTPQHNGVSERRNRTLLDMVRSMMSLNTLPMSFWGYALESAAHILNMVPTKKVNNTPYEMWHGKVPNLSVRIPQAPERYGFYIDAEEHELGDHGEPPNYRAALSDPESEKWLDAMNAEMQSMKDNQVWNLVDLPPNCKTVGSKWLFKKKTDMDGNIHTYKARLVAKGFTQTYGVDYEEIFSPVADIKAIRILIAITAYYDYEI
ncbi:zinc knuckle CX2CX4HX4C containing protein [Tanacetum coccineum]